MTKSRTLHYLNSIKINLNGLVQQITGPSLQSEVIADNRDWLDCFIDTIERDKNLVVRWVKCTERMPPPGVNVLCIDYLERVFYSRRQPWINPPHNACWSTIFAELGQPREPLYWLEGFNTPNDPEIKVHIRRGLKSEFNGLGVPMDVIQKFLEGPPV